MEREYIVTVHAGVDLDQLDAEMIALKQAQVLFLTLLLM